MGGFKGQTQGAALNEKVRMLEAEGIVIRDGRIQNFDAVLFRFG